MVVVTWGLNAKPQSLNLHTQHLTYKVEKMPLRLVVTRGLHVPMLVRVVVTGTTVTVTVTVIVIRMPVRCALDVVYFKRGAARLTRHWRLVGHVFGL